MKSKRLPVVEIFGPTIQGEGSHAGETAHFVRFGGCDFKCTWCDTPHAVIASEVRETKEDLTPLEIACRLRALGPAQWIVITGGNPALHDLSELVSYLHDYGFKVSVETQGTRYQPWLTQVDSVCLSPKPPSSGQAMPWPKLKKIVDQLDRFCGDNPLKDSFLKVVVFDEHDYDFAVSMRLAYPGMPLYLSTGNDAGRTVGNPTRNDSRNVNQVRLDLLNSAEALVAQVLHDPRMVDVVVQSQFHVLLWGNKQGV